GAAWRHDALRPERRQRGGRRGVPVGAAPFRRDPARARKRARRSHDDRRSVARRGARCRGGSPSRRAGGDRGRIAIAFHEFGHFATAKAFGIKVDKFFIGFGPKLWSTRRGETEYGVSAFPIGGYVK